MTAPEARDAAGAERRFGLVPAELRERPQWVNWCLEPAQAKRTKVPYRPGPARSGRASTADATTWGTFDGAASGLGWADGLGFVFTAEDPYVGVDLDGCRDPVTGSIEDGTAAILDRLDSYSEISPSGRGVHLILRGRLDRPGNRSGTVEVYDRGRFFCVTGMHIAGTPGEVMTRQAELDAWHADVFATAAHPATRIDRSVADVVARASSGARGAKFRDLHEGRWRPYYRSQSEADLGYLSLLLDSCGGDVSLADAVFRTSALYRPKWERDDYRASTLNRALQPASPERNRSHVPKDGAAAPPVEWKTVSWSGFRDTVDPDVPYLVDSVIPVAGLGFLASAPKRGKTWLAVDLAVAVTTGTSWLGHAVTRAQPVVYVCLEGQRSALRARIGCLARGRGIDPDATDSLTGLHLSTRREIPACDLMRPEWTEALHATASAHDAGLVVIDVLRSAAPNLQETGKGAVDFAAIREGLATLQADGITALLLHHFVKGSLGEERFVGELMTGSGALYGALDFGIFITPSTVGEHWEREMPLTFEARDFEPPTKFIARLGGEASGRNASLIYGDTAHIDAEMATAAAARIERHVMKFLAGVHDHGGYAPMSSIVKGVGGHAQHVRAAVTSLAAKGQIEGPAAPEGFRRNTKAYRLTSGPVDGTRLDEVDHEVCLPVPRPPLREGRGTDTQPVAHSSSSSSADEVTLGLYTRLVESLSHLVGDKPAPQWANQVWTRACALEARPEELADLVGAVERGELRAPKVPPLADEPSADSADDP
jgi:putative DNA primase/helicase